MILVVGATGLLGQEICRQVAATGNPLKALVRSTSDPAKREQLQQLGAVLVEGDLKDPSSLAAACEGVTAVISTASATFSRQSGDSIQTVDRDGQLNLVEAAQASGVEHFVYISFPDNPDVSFPLDEAKRAVEQRLRKSTMTSTIVQASYFMEVWLSPAVGFDYPNATARVYGAGQSGISWISYKDVAAFAVASLDNPAGHDAVVQVGGPEILSPLEVVQIFEEVGGQRFEIEHVPVDALQTQLANATDGLEATFAALMLTCAKGDPIEMDATLKVFPVDLSSVRDYAKSVLASTY